MKREYSREYHKAQRWTVQKLEEAIRNTTLEHNTGIEGYDRLPETIELPRTLLQDMRYLAQWSGDYRMEYGFQLFLQPDKTITVQPNEYWMAATVESPDDIHFSMVPEFVLDSIDDFSPEQKNSYQAAIKELVLANEQGRVDQFLLTSPHAPIIRETHQQVIGVVHSHVNPGATFSENDIALLLAHPNMRLMPMIDTAGTLYALLPTHETPHVNGFDEYKALLSEWNNDADKGRQQAKMLLEQKRERGESINLEIMHLLLQEGLVMHLAQKYKLGYYKGDLNGFLQRIQ